MLVALLDPWLPWREQWLALGVIGLPLAWLAHRWVPRPEVASHPFQERQPSGRSDDPHRRVVRRLQLAYFCAGFGYVVSATFLVDMLEGIEGLEPIAPWAWLLVGLAAAPSCLVWERIAERLAPIPALMLAWLLQIAGIALPVLHPSAETVLAGALLFGFTFMGIVALVLTVVGRRSAAGWRRTTAATPTPPCWPHRCWRLALFRFPCSCAAASNIRKRRRSRDTDYSAPPAQIPA